MEVAEYFAQSTVHVTPALVGSIRHMLLTANRFAASRLVRLKLRPFKAQPNPTMLRELTKERTQKCKQFTAKLMKEQRARDFRRRESAQKREAELEFQAERQRQLQAETNARRQQQLKADRLRELQERSELRKMRSQSLKQFANCRPAATPLYKKIQAQHSCLSSELPEASPVKKSPIKHEEFMQHSRWYSQQKAVLKGKHCAAQRATTAGYRQLIEVERRRYAELAEPFARKAGLVEKRKLFASLVKALYVPQVDPRKQRELATLAAPRKMPVRLRPKSIFTPTVRPIQKVQTKSAVLVQRLPLTTSHSMPRQALSLDSIKKAGAGNKRVLEALKLKAQQLLSAS